MNLREFLSYFDFDYDIVSPGGKRENRIRQELVEDGKLSVEDAGMDLICLIDLQGAYFGDIGNERFPIAAGSTEKIVERMDIYVQESVFDEFRDALEERGIDAGLISLDEMIEKCRELGVGDGEVCYELAEAVANPEGIMIQEVAELESGLYDIGVLARRVRDMVQSFLDLNDDHWDGLSVRMPLQLEGLSGFGMVVQAELGYMTPCLAVSIYKDFSENDNGIPVMRGETDWFDMDQLEKLIKDGLSKLKTERGTLEDKIRSAENAGQDVADCLNITGKDFEK